MTDNVSRVPLPVTLGAESKPTPTVTTLSNTEINAAENQPRLAIEAGPSGFVYKVMDRVTGEVLRQIPHESLVKMAEDPEYGAGGVIATKA